MPLNQLLKNIAIDTWDRLEFANKFGLKYSEVTITENLIYELYKFNTLYKSNYLELFEAKDEKANGNDIELYVEIEKDMYLYFAIQAKRVYISKRFKYSQLSHKVSGKYQIDLLDDYAKSNNAVPLYLLYNYYDGSSRKLKNKEHHYGCSLIGTEYIRTNFKDKKAIGRWLIPNYVDLNLEHTKPLYLLNQRKLLLKYLDDCLNIDVIQPYTRTRHQLLSSEWIPIKELSLNKKTKKISIEKQSIKFNPSKRIIIGLNNE